MTLALRSHPTLDAPHRQRPDESAGEFALFTQWWTTHPRPEVPPELATLALERDWRRRAQVLDHRLRSDPLTPDQAMRMALVDSAAVWQIEMQELHVQSLRNPGRLKPRDIAAIGKVVVDAGAVAAMQDGATQYDFRECTDAELDTLMQADAIRARCRVSP